MSRRKSVPSYRHHKPTNQAVVTVPLPGGGRRDVYLGVYGTPKSRTEYARVIADLKAGRLPGDQQEPPAGPAVPVDPGADPSVNEVLLAFWRHAEVHYRRPDGTPTKEVGEYRSALRRVKQLYGHTPAAEFGPRKLIDVRAWMVRAG